MVLSVVFPETCFTYYSGLWTPSFLHSFWAKTGHLLLCEDMLQLPCGLSGCGSASPAHCFTHDDLVAFVHDAAVSDYLIAEHSVILDTDRNVLFSPLTWLLSAMLVELRPPWCRH